MLQRSGKQNQINFLESISSSNSKKDEIRKETEDESVRRVAEEQKSKKLNNSDNGLKNSKSIMSTGYNEESVLINSQKHIGCETSNSIFGETTESKMAKKSEELNDNFVTLNVALKQKIADKRTKNLNKKQVQTASSTKVVFSKNDKETHDFGKISTNMSIFDTNPFEKVPEKTEGEKLAENKIKTEKISSQKDQRPLKSQSLVSDMFDRLNNKE